MVEQVRPTLNLLEHDMEQRLGEAVKIKMRIARDYRHGVELMVKREADFARLGAASYIETKDADPSLDLLAVERFGAVGFHRGIICVRIGSDIASIEQLKGKSFAFGAESSTIARYLAQLYLAKNGITSADLKSFKYLERHDRVGTAIGAGEFDAGVLEDTIFFRQVSSGVPIRAIASFPSPTKAWVVRSDLDVRVKDALKSALLAIKDTAALLALRSDGFMEVKDSDFADLRAAIQENDRFFRRTSSAVDIIQ